MRVPARGCGAARYRPHATDATPSPTGSKERSTRPWLPAGGRRRILPSSEGRAGPPRSVASELVWDETRTEAGDGRKGATEGAGRPRRLGPYELLGRLGQGGMGVVHLGRQRRGGRLAAVKALRP